MKDEKKKKKRKTALRDPLPPFCRFVNAQEPSIAPPLAHKTRRVRANEYPQNANLLENRASVVRTEAQKNDDARFPPLRAQKKISLSERARFPRPPRGEERKNTQRRERRIPRVSHKSRAEIPSERGKDKKNVPLLVVCVMWFYIYITLNNGEIFFS